MLSNYFFKKVFSKNNSLNVESKKVLFYRNYHSFRGSHLKVWNYFNYLKDNDCYEPKIFFSKSSILDKENPWKDIDKLDIWQPEKADILFLSGLDWQVVLSNEKFLDKRKKIPIINLIQGLSHARRDNIKYSFLSEKAIRICVSDEVKNAIQKTSKVNGPIFTIPNGLDQHAMPAFIDLTKKNIDILIVSLKNRDLGQKIEYKLNTILNDKKRIVNISQMISRKEFLEKINSSTTTIFLPKAEEGFYLPALEAMKLGSLVICPDVKGNREYCISNINCFIPDEYNSTSIVKTFIASMNVDTKQRLKIIAAAEKTANKYSLAGERLAFMEIISNINNIW